MVTYGPWQDGVERTETWTLGPKPGDPTQWQLATSIDPVPIDESDVEIPWVGVSGMTASRVAAPTGVDTETRGKVLDVEEDGYGQDVVSQEAWANAEGEGGGGDGQTNAPNITYDGAVGVPAGVSAFEHTERWEVWAFEFGPEFLVPEGGTDWNGLAGIPDTPPPGAAYAQFDPARFSNALLAEVLSMDVDFALGGDARWELAVRDFDATGDSATDVDRNGWGLDDAGATPFATRDGALLGNSGTYSWDVSALDAWKAEANPPFTSVVPSRLPALAVTWTGGWPGDALGGDKDYDLPGAEIEVTVVWRTARWRWVYPDIETIPIQQTSHRDDHLAGGAFQTWPPPTSEQQSNQTFGGYL